jgi:hypothetical protein
VTEKRCTHHGVVVVGEPGPLPCTHPGLVLGRGHDVGEENRHGQDVGLAPAAGTGQELLDLVHYGVGVAHYQRMVVAGQDHELGIGAVLGQ